ncbi:MAG: HD domain-containing protein [Candidatus Aminicenantales bacterium]
MAADFKDKAFFVRLFGEDVYAVGGFVRDLIMGTPSEEVDILITRHLLEDIIKKIKPFGRVDLVGKSFGIIKLTIKGRAYDIALPRKDAPVGEKIRGHKDIRVSAEPNLPIEKDLERRDFRCNSIALRLADNTLIDPFLGAKDIKARMIRVTNSQAFPEDPLRVLRAARFAARLNFTVDPAIYEISRGIDLSGLSVERVNEELFKILMHSPLPSSGLEELFRLGALRQLFPELYNLTLVIQDSLFHPEKDIFGHHTVWHHTKLTVDQAKRLADFARLEPAKKLALLLAALYHDVGKSDTTQWEFKKGRMVITSAGHDNRSEKMTRRMFNRFKIFSWNGYNLRKIVLLLIKTHHRASELWQNRHAITRKAFNRLAADVNGEIELLIYLDAADRGGRKKKLLTGLDREAKWLLKKFEEYKINRDTIKPMIMGRDLLKKGVTPGPEMGKILKHLYHLQLDNVFETKAQGLQIAKKIIQKNA